MHLLGVNLPDSKAVHIALTYFYGIGPYTARGICSRLAINKQCRLRDLTDTQITQLSTELSGMTLESDLRREVRGNILHHRVIGSYRGRRHVMGLPVRGQRTRTNAKTAKKLNGRWMKDMVMPQMGESRFYSR